MMYADQHLHTSFSGDSEVSPEEQIEKAIALGMERICVTDHNDFDVVSDIDFDLDMPRYFEEMNRLREKYAGRIKISVGVEQGLQEHIKDHLEETAEKYPFDLIIGSVHFVHGLDPYYPEYFEKYSGKKAYEDYFDTLYKCVCMTDAYDTLGHLDYIVRYGAGHGLSYSYDEYKERIDPILRRLIDRGKALELNTGGIFKGTGEPNPCMDIIRAYRQMGGELITIGSDAHIPEAVGYAFERCGEMLKECGFRYYTVYNNRKPEMLYL